MATSWISLLGGLLMLAGALLLPRLRRRVGPASWDQVFTSERLRRIARTQERAAQVALAAMGAAFAIPGGGDLLGLPRDPLVLASYACFLLAAVALVAQVAIVFRSRRGDP